RSYISILRSFRASFASGIHNVWSAVTTSHSFITRQRPGSTREPLPAATSSLTRSSDSLTTNSPFDEIMANIFPFTLRAPDPNPLPVPGGVTCRSSAKALTTRANLLSRSRVGADVFPFIVRVLPVDLLSQRLNLITLNPSYLLNLCLHI